MRNLSSLSPVGGRRLLSLVVFLGLLFSVPGAQALIVNGDFEADLTGWESAGSVTTADGTATLIEGSEDPVVYQPIAVSGYVYELRFDVYLGGLSSDVGTGTLDTAQVVLYVGMDASSLTPTSAADESILIVSDADGLVSVANNAQVVANAALGEGWYSAVVEAVSDFTAIAPAARIVDGNALADSTIRLDNVSIKPLDRGRFANISNRGGVGTGANIMIPGFVIAGPTNRSLVIRGVGPTLGEFGVPGTITDPQLKLYYRPPGGAGDELKGENDNWEQSADVDALTSAMVSVGAFAFEPGSADAALLAEDLVPGAYTVQVSGVADGTGVALAEVYDLGASADGATELVNISNRGFIGTDSDVQIPGFVIRGTRGRVVLARAVGPTLGAFGVTGTIEDPVLNLYSQADTETPLLTNDNWSEAMNATEVEATAARVGAFALESGSKDAAILASLPPGEYTAVAAGVGDATGVALVEVYVVTSNQRPTAVDDAFVATTDLANVLPMEGVFGNDTDPENDVLSVGYFTQPGEGAVTLNDEGELVYTSSDDFWGHTAFSYRASDGEYESVPATIALEVRPEGVLVWQGGSSEDFSDPANWVGGVAPGADDPVWIAPDGGGTVVVDTDTEVASIWVGGGISDVNLKTNGKNLTATGGLKVQPGSTLELKGGTLNTTGDAIIRGQLISSEEVTLAGAGTLIIAPEGSADFSGRWLLADGHGVTNQGTLNQTAGVIWSVTPDATSTITNAAGAQWSVDLAFGNNIASPTDAASTLHFVNDGTLTKTNYQTNLFGGGKGAFSLTNTGTIDVAAGDLVLAGGEAVLGGVMNAAAGALLNSQVGTTTVTPEARFTGDGGLRANSGIVTIEGDHEIAVLESGHGSLVINGDLSVGRLVHGDGTLSGLGDVTVTGTLEWFRGAHSGTGTTIIAEGATALLSGSVYLREGRGFTNEGTVTQTTSAQLVTDTAGSTSTITNAAGALWTSNQASTLYIALPNHPTATLNFVNDGTLTKSGTGTNTLGTRYNTMNLTGSGVLNVESGTLKVETDGLIDMSGALNLADGTFLGFKGGTATLSGSVTVGAGATLQAGLDTSLTFADGAEMSSTGTLHAYQGSITLHDAYTLQGVQIDAGGTLVTNDALSVGDLELAAATLSGPGDVTVTGSFAWGSSSPTTTVMSGEGATIFAAGANVSISIKAVFLRGGRDLTNYGTVTQSGAGQIIADSQNTSSTITNAAGAQWTVDYATDAYCVNLGFSNVTLDFINEGTLTKSGSAKAYLGGSTGTFNVTQNGILEVNEGPLVFGGTSVVLGAGGTVGLTTDGTTVPLERTGSLAIGGTLEVNLADGYAPPNGTTIRLIEYTSKSGTFGTVTPPQGRAITESYESDGLDVTLN